MEKNYLPSLQKIKQELSHYSSSNLNTTYLREGKINIGLKFEKVKYKTQEKLQLPDFIQYSFLSSLSSLKTLDNSLSLSFSDFWPNIESKNNISTYRLA